MKYLLPIVIITLIVSCNKLPGEGGTSSIQGTVWIKNYDQTFGTLIAEYEGADIDVYLIYGDNETYNDRVKTGPDGTFEFYNLQKGDYSVYVYSKDSTLQSPSGDIVLQQDLVITDKKQQVVVPQFTVLD